MRMVLSLNPAQSFQFNVRGYCMIRSVFVEVMLLQKDLRSSRRETEVKTANFQHLIKNTDLLIKIKL